MRLQFISCNVTSSAIIYETKYLKLKAKKKKKKSFEQIWIHFPQAWFVLSVVKIGWVVLEKKIF
jgi:hypothetical protein